MTTWIDASKRPPKEGRYLVWGLHEFIPDHCDQPNALWQTQIATWNNRTGWSTKVKYWMPLPEPPEEWTLIKEGEQMTEKKELLPQQPEGFVPRRSSPHDPATCGRCGAELMNRQEYCPRCGGKVQW